MIQIIYVVVYANEIEEVHSRKNKNERPFVERRNKRSKNEKYKWVEGENVK